VTSHHVESVQTSVPRLKALWLELICQKKTGSIYQKLDHPPNSFRKIGGEKNPTSDVGKETKTERKNEVVAI
jgi:hypothetical protein